MTAVQSPRTLALIDRDLSEIVALRQQARRSLRGRITSDERATLITRIEVQTEKIESLLEERSRVSFVEQIVSL